MQLNPFKSLSGFPRLKALASQLLNRKRGRKSRAPNLSRFDIFFSGKVSFEWLELRTRTMSTQHEKQTRKERRSWFRMLNVSEGLGIKPFNSSQCMSFELKKTTAWSDALDGVDTEGWTGTIFTGRINA